MSLNNIKGHLNQAASDLHILDGFIKDIQEGKSKIDLDLIQRLTVGAKKSVELAEEKRYQIECSLR